MSVVFVAVRISEPVTTMVSPMSASAACGASCATAALAISDAPRIAGAALALLSLYIVYHPVNVAVVFNPIEQMMLYALGSNPELAQEGPLVTWERMRVLLAELAKLDGRSK